MPTEKELRKIVRETLKEKIEAPDRLKNKTKEILLQAQANRLGKKDDLANMNAPVELKGGLLHLGDKRFSPDRRMK